MVNLLLHDLLKVLLRRLPVLDRLSRDADCVGGERAFSAGVLATRREFSLRALMVEQNFALEATIEGLGALVNRRGANQVAFGHITLVFDRWLELHVLHLEVFLADWRPVKRINPTLIGESSLVPVLSQVRNLIQRGQLLAVRLPSRPGHDFHNVAVGPCGEHDASDEGEAVERVSRRLLH